ncbi:hypothetical protein SAMN04488513_101758 [Pseudozobellia thermophila]|uniref:Uncharacterized protein n=2 Tax=Pseudozobellia thermophila TaxID=192903 RepID=A0A1M6CGP3_9FLAO|nr:hypothetical protein SAMN04488513_101758 [Pseudozobellia thermophila]
MALLLSVLTIFLSSYPCCQETSPCSEISCADNIGNDGSEDVPHGKDHPCSPFTTCGRCAGFTLSFTQFTFDLVEPEIKIPPVPYLAPLPKEVYFHELKPPRIFEV